MSSEDYCRRPMEFDFFQPDILACPYPFYETILPTQSPIIKVPGSDMFIVFSMEIVRHVLQRHDLFSSRTGDAFVGKHSTDPAIQAIVEQGWPFEETLLTADPPEHTRFRKLVNLAFSRPRVDAIEKDIRKTVVDLLEPLLKNRSGDFVENVATPLPILVVAQQIGLGDLTYQKIKDWADAASDRFGGLITRERELECAELLLEFQQHMAELIEKRRQEPGQDLLNALVNSRQEGAPPPSVGELLSILQQLMTAGSETTAHTLAVALKHLAVDQGLQSEMREDIARIPSFVEELLRLESPGQGLMRRALVDTELAGVAVPAGAWVMPRLAAANRDERIFEDAARIKPGRTGINRHVAFGSGIHACVGSMLARKEVVVALQELLTRTARISLSPSHVDEYTCNTLTRGLTRLDLLFELAE